MEPMPPKTGSIIPRHQGRIRGAGPAPTDRPRVSGTLSDISLRSPPMTRKATSWKAPVSDTLKAVIIACVAALVIAVLAIGPEKVWCQVRGGDWVEGSGLSICL